ncbi:MAG: hypothetical protein GY805_04255 [Chloroflexi bacterium]|nr:hypothetical protein [Chloroflexota bacterium]
MSNYILQETEQIFINSVLHIMEKRASHLRKDRLRTARIRPFLFTIEPVN